MKFPQETSFKLNKCCYEVPLFLLGCPIFEAMNKKHNPTHINVTRNNYKQVLASVGFYMRNDLGKPSYSESFGNICVRFRKTIIFYTRFYAYFFEKKLQKKASEIFLTEEGGKQTY